MKQRVFIKACGMDAEGNLQPKAPDGVQAQPYLQEGVLITSFDPYGVYDDRNPTFDPEDGELVFERTIAEVIASKAEKIANGRPYFIGSVVDQPVDRLFREAWRYDETTTPHSVRVDLGAAKAICEAVMIGHVRNIVGQAYNPLLSAADNDARRVELIAHFDKVDFSGLQTLSELKAYLEMVLNS